MTDNLRAPYKPDLCIYHGGCDDGFAAAWAIWKRWPDCEFAPGVYGKAPPDVGGKRVLMVDFSYKYDVLSEMSWKSRSLVVIDHHKTAQADLERVPSFSGDFASLDEALFICMTNNMPEIAAWFDMEQSGAAMAFAFAHPDEVTPSFINYVEDRDLWKFKYGEETKKFSASLRTYPMEFKTWDRLITAPTAVYALINDGEAILRAHNANIEKFIKEAYMVASGADVVPTVNVPYHYASDVAHALLQKYPEAPYASCWFRRADGMTQYSLRSEDSRADVSEIAKRYGGGGHRNAAGYQVRG